jgi:hypothetical protein
MHKSPTAQWYQPLFYPWSNESIYLGPRKTSLAAKMNDESTDDRNDGVYGKIVIIWCKAFAHEPKNDAQQPKTLREWQRNQ